MALELKPPLPPMEARSVEDIPTGERWQYEPKWDGFRCLAFRDGDQIQLQSKSGQPLERYFPEVVASLAKLRARQFVLDSEIVIPIAGRLSFDELLLRIHPAESRGEGGRSQIANTFLDGTSHRRNRSGWNVQLVYLRR